MTVLAFLAPVPHGHSNVHFTIYRSLLALPADKAPSHIHIIGDEPLRKRIDQLALPSYCKVSFHALDPVDIFDVIISDKSQLRVPPLSVLKPGGLRGLRGHFVPIVCPPSAVYLSRYQRILAALEKIQPDLVIIDVIFVAVGLDACRTLNLRYAILAPTASLEISVMSQPGGRGLWKYPMLFTNHTYPLPLLSIPLNILVAIAFILTLMVHPARRALDADRKVAGLSGSVLSPPGENAVCIIYASLAELEYPHVPNPRTVFAGPILTPVPPVDADTYPDMAAFLARGRTILINMGTLFKYDTDDVNGVVEGIVAARRELQNKGGLQVLWKLPDISTFEALLDERLGSPTQRQEWVRIEKWINPPALAVLQHPNLVASVHHGGANSVHEAAYAGVPQVILPQWYDLYTFATRVETMGHGIYANRGSETKIDAAKLAAALITVCGGSAEGEKIRERATELGHVCRRTRGDERAAGAILAAARGEQLEGIYF